MQSVRLAEQRGERIILISECFLKSILKQKVGGYGAVEKAMIPEFCQ